ncbi:MAG: hypothetical protein JXQ83_10830, partial [Candidatus Glassbacteria bacterium]|nr:hypothetical protein [Candidatus Glassbacteria bacterium]
SENWSRNQHSYPSGYQGEGDYFQTGLFYEGDPLWEGRDWGGDTVVYVPQAYARRIKTHNLLTGFDWDILRTANRSASFQFRFSYFGSVGVNQGSIETDYERDTFMSWSTHDVRFEIERYYNKEGPHADLGEKWVDGALGWKQGVDYESPFEMGQYTAYYMNYDYSRERQRNFKADLDFQLDRYNRAKLGFQYTYFNLWSFGTNYKAEPLNPLDIYPKYPEIWSAYIQNRTDVGDLVVNYGLRYDGYAPKTNWGTTSYDPHAEGIQPNVQTSLSPRFDVAFPVTEKTQFRFSYGVFTQLPSLNYMLRIQTDSRNEYNLGNLGYARTDAFEAGMSYLLTNDMVLDLVAYYRDIDGNLATKEFFRDYYLWYTERRVRETHYGAVNRDNGNIKGLDLQVRKRFSDNFSFDLMYTMQFSRTTGSAPNTPSLEGNLDPATGEQYVPPDELRPIDNDRTHKLTCQFNYLFPDDFKSGTLANTILKNFRTYAAFTLLSGEPLLDIGTGNWTQFDNTSLTRDAAGRRVGGLNFFRGAWSYDLSLRFSKQFSLGAKRRVSVFTEVFNALNYRNNRPYPSGYTLEPYTHVTGGVDLVWSDLSSDNANLPRFNADFDGNGILTVEEAALGAIAQSVMDDTMDKRKWGRARQIRTGLELTF